MRVVLDTNVLFSGFLFGNIPGSLILAAETKRIQLVSTEALIIELKETLEKPKSQRYLAAGDVTVEQLILQFRSAADIVEPANVLQDALSDPDDIGVLACAVGGNAEAIVTGDDHLLKLGSYAGIPILTPRAMLDRLNSPE